MSADPRLLQRLCELAALDLDGAEAERFAAKLERVVASLDRLASLDLPEPTSTPPEAPTPLRADEAAPPFDASSVLERAPDAVDGWFGAPPPEKR